MINPTTGDIFTADAQALVNTVNCVGVMGRGLALQFKKAFPDNFAAYKTACDRKQVQPGEMFVFETGAITNPKYIINFPTKRHWRDKSRMEDIDSGLLALVQEIRQRQIRSIAIPPLGSNLGGLQWSDVRPRIVAALRDLPNLQVILFEPSGPPESVKLRNAPDMTPARAILIMLMNRYLGGFMDPFVSLLEIHKLMYFMQEAGEPLGLRYEKALYGPYAENLRHLLHTMEGHMIAGYADGGDAPDKQIELLPGALQDAEALLSDQPETMVRFDRVSQLVEGFEQPSSLEILATVHWVATREAANTPEDAVAAAHAWNDRKQQFSPRRIGIAFAALQDKGWLSLPQSPVLPSTSLSPNPEPRVDLTDPAVRERLSPNAIRAFFRIMERWKVGDEDARLLLGETSSDAFHAMKKNPERTLGEDNLRRISFLLGMFEALNIVYSRELADKWMRLPNQESTFQGEKPLEYLKRGNLSAFASVRNLLKAQRWGY